MAESYYAARSRHDPEWRRQAIAGALERERARRERDPEAFRACRREATRRTRPRQAATGLTFHELWLRVGGDRASLAHLLRDEVARGRIDYHGASRRYHLNGGLDPATR